MMKIEYYQRIGKNNKTSIEKKNMTIVNLGMCDRVMSVWFQLERQSQKCQSALLCGLFDDKQMAIEKKAIA